MAPHSGALALKAAAVTAVLAMLVVPSLGRCRGSPSPAPPPPPPTPTPPPPAPSPPTPAPSPGPISCNDCYTPCYLSCDASIPSNCSRYCDNIEVSCNSCKTRAIEECRTRKNCTGSCDECNDAPNFSCASDCSPRHCNECHTGGILMCQETCSKECKCA